MSKTIETLSQTVPRNPPVVQTSFEMKSPRTKYVPTPTKIGPTAPEILKKIEDIMNGK